MDTTTSPRLRYVFDPLCGWCYAAAPALAGLADAFDLAMMPSGLFAAPRPVASIADHAWSNDRRIAASTGQPFSEAYHRNVLLAPDGVFDSTALTRALVSLGERDRRLEPLFLHRAQIVRYVDGVDTSLPAKVAPIAAAVAREAGIAVDADTLARQLLDDPALRGRTDARIRATQREMNALGISGVPQLVLDTGERQHVIDGRHLYAGSGPVIDHIAALCAA